MKWRLAGLGAGMIAVAGTALADPECRPIAPPQDRPYPGTIRLHVDAADINHRVFHVHETLPVMDGEELVLLYPEWLPGTHSPSGRNRINKLAGLTVSAGNTPLGWRRDACDVFAFRIMPPQGTASIEVDFDYLSADMARAVRGAAPRSAPTFWCWSGRRWCSTRRATMCAGSRSTRA